MTSPAKRPTMIFERITLHNFQRYWGTSTIDFPSANGSKSIVLVLAPNNSGKTTILRALRFLLYGHLAGNQRETAWNLANDRCRREADVGENIDVWVEARLSIGDKEPITLRRQLQTRQSGPDRWVTEGPFLQSKKTDRPNERFAVDADGSLQLQIDAAVPQDLFSWFYFAGEPAEGKMSHGNSGALTEPLKKAIQIRRWADAIHTAQGVLANLKSTLQRETRNHGAYSELLRKKDVVSRSKGENQEALLQIKGELHSLQQKYDELDSECLRTSRKAEESQKLYQRLKDQEPPLPLVLDGWHYSSDVDKQIHWRQVVDWAERNAKKGLITVIKFPSWSAPWSARPSPAPAQILSS